MDSSGLALPQPILCDGICVLAYWSVFFPLSVSPNALVSALIPPTALSPPRLAPFENSQSALRQGGDSPAEAMGHRAKLESPSPEKPGGSPQHCSPCLLRDRWLPFLCCTGKFRHVFRKMRHQPTNAYSIYCQYRAKLLFIVYPPIFS